MRRQWASPRLRHVRSSGTYSRRATTTCAHGSSVAWKASNSSSTRWTASREVSLRIYSCQQSTKQTKTRRHSTVNTWSVSTKTSRQSSEQMIRSRHLGMRTAMSFTTQTSSGLRTGQLEWRSARSVSSKVLRYSCSGSTLPSVLRSPTWGLTSQPSSRSKSSLVRSAFPRLTTSARDTQRWVSS